MSSSVLDNKIRHSILFSHEPFHPFPLKGFGFTCFVHNFSHGFDKLFVRLQKCIILGFTRSEKEYKYFSLSFNRYFISANITITESFLLLLCFHLIKVNIPVVRDPPVVSNASKDLPPPPTF